MDSAGSTEIVVMSVPPLQNTADLQSDPERNSNIPIKHYEFDHLGKVRFPGSLWNTRFLTCVGRVSRLWTSNVRKSSGASTNNYWPKTLQYFFVLRTRVLGGSEVLLETQVADSTVFYRGSRGSSHNNGTSVAG